MSSAPPDSTSAPVTSDWPPSATHSAGLSKSPSGISETSTTTATGGAYESSDEFAAMLQTIHERDGSAVHPDPVEPLTLEIVTRRHGFFDEADGRISKHVQAQAQAGEGVHLLVVSHGLYGNSSHVRFVVDTMADKHPDLVVLNCSSYSVTLTLDGVDVCGERMIREIMEFTRQCPIRKISFLGYSLGGLIIRYAAGRLVQSGFFDTIEPMNLITMATPHLGINSQRAYVASLILFRTGLQGTLNDTDYGAPFLWVLTDPNMPFMKALKLFPQVLIAANVVGDRTVPYLTASAQLVNPYDTCPPVPLDPSNPVIVKPASAPPPEKKGMEALKAQAETAVRMTVFLAVIVPILVVAWTVLGPVGLYQARQAQARHAKSDIKHAGVDLSDEDRRKLNAMAEEVKALPGAHDEWQRRIAQTFEEELNGRMTRVDVWLGEWRHTHAIIVVRKPSLAMHREGVPAVEHIAGLFKS